MSEGPMTMITLDGDLTLPRAQELKELFMKSLAKAGNVGIAFGEVNEADLSFLQLCCSLHGTASRGNKTVSFAGKTPRPLRDAADAAGFLRLTGCALYGDRHCLWAELAAHAE
jgi:hypothetical protein